MRNKIKKEMVYTDKEGTKYYASASLVNQKRITNILLTGILITGIILTITLCLVYFNTGIIGTYLTKTIC